MCSNQLAFESRPSLFETSDIYVYNIATNLLYQITNTPLLTEHLNDISVLPDGRIRVVWTSDEDGFDQRNVHSSTFSLSGPSDVTPPVITPHANITANATTASGALVNFVVQATDDVGVISLVCAQASGSVFPIGTVHVQCTASDAAGNSASTGFNVKVKGAPEQIVDLMAVTISTPMPAILKLRLLTSLAIALVSQYNKPVACAALTAFISHVQSQPPSAIPPAKKAQMIADAVRIKTLLGCP